MKASASGRENRLFVVFLLALLFFFLVWQLRHLGGFRWDWDEGVYALTAAAVLEGHALYADVISSAPPLFVASLVWAFRLLGQTVEAGRAVVVLYSALGLLGVGLLAREWGGRLAGLVAVAVLAIAPHFYVLSRTIIADIPSMGLASLALWAAVRYERTGRRGWLAFGGLVLSLGVLLKLTAGLVGPVIVLLALSRDLRRGLVWREAAVSMALLALAFAVPLGVCLAAFAPDRLVEQVVGILIQQRGTFAPDPAANAQMVFRYLLRDNFNIALNRGMTLMSLAGVAALSLRGRRDALFWVAWMAVVLVVLVTYAPLWPHLLSPVLFPLAVGAGVAVGELHRWISMARRGDAPGAKSVPTLALVLCIAGLVAYLYDLPGLVAENGRRGRAPGGEAEQAVLGVLEQRTEVGDYVVTDEPLLAFVARRGMPPSLIDCSIVRMATGSLQVADFMQAMETYRPAAVVLWNADRFPVYMPGYVSWVEQHYALVWEGDGGRRLLARP